MTKRIVEIFVSIYIWLMLVILTVFFTTLILILSPFVAPLDPNRRVAHRLCAAWGRSIILFNPFWKLSVKGKGYLKKDKAYVLAANHMSLSDILCLFYLNRHFKWVAKDSLFKIPFLGWSMSAAGYVPLERGKHGSIKESYEKSLEWLERGISVLIFPEGTRAASGKLGNFKNGAFKLAIESKTPIVPVVLSGTRDIIQRGSWLFKPKVRAKIKILKPIPVGSYSLSEFGALRDRVRVKIEEELTG